MTENTKIALSSSELKLVCDKEWILTKHVITEKVYQLFGKLASSMQQIILQNTALLPAEATSSNPKISKGENYRQLPYVILDYPRYFTKESTLAVRTLFWWGNFFSINLHLSGSCKDQAIHALNKNFEILQQHGYRICIHPNPWEHHFEEDNYVSLENYDAGKFSTEIENAPFIKIAKNISLQRWDEAEEFLERHFNELITLLKINFRGDEKGL